MPNGFIWPIAAVGGQFPVGGRIVVGPYAVRAAMLGGNEIEVLLIRRTWMLSGGIAPAA
jgi:hypothetical protein